MATAARSRWILALLLLVAIVIVWRTRKKPAQTSVVAYVADRAATLWSSTAQVRHPVATLGYGERVQVVRRSGDEAEVQTDDGAQGWVDANLLMDAALWNRSEEVLARARSLSVQAVGRTRNLSNVHIEPGRDTARIYQFGRDVPVVVLERKVLAAPLPPPSEKTVADETNSSDDDKPKQEDWLLVARDETPAVAAGSTSAVSGVQTQMGGGIPVAGWVLARFVDLDPPSPLGDYISSAGLRVVGWAVLNTIPTDSGAKPQYVVAATSGPEGQPCDFTALRVYTWGDQHQRYETAYAESAFCGVLPIRVAQTSAGPEFHFATRDRDASERVYVMKQTIVRRVRDSQSAGANRR